MSNESLHDTIQLSHSLSFPSLPDLSLSQHQSRFQRFTPSHQVAKCCEILGISPNEFFEWEIEQAPPMPYMAAEGFMAGAPKSKELSALLNQLAVKDREIDRLLRIIEANAGVEKEKRSV